VPIAALAVLFDLDDTLFDHSGSVRTALAAWLPHLPAADLGQLIDVWFDLERVHYDSWRAGDISFDEQRRRRIQDFWPHLGRELNADDDLDALFATYLTHYEHAWQAFDDAGPVLTELRRLGYLTAVLTNGATAQQNAKIEQIGLRNLLSAVITSEQLGVAKPDPSCYLSACQQLGVEPQQTLHVGDRYDLDVLSARAAELHALHLDRNGTGVRDSDERITSLHELPARLVTTTRAESS
jgi:putative hydrolase of the HAD superfamily